MRTESGVCYSSRPHFEICSGPKMGCCIHDLSDLSWNANGCYEKQGVDETEGRTPREMGGALST